MAPPSSRTGKERSNKNRHLRLCSRSLAFPLATDLIIRYLIRSPAYDDELDFTPQNGYYGEEDEDEEAAPAAPVRVYRLDRSKANGWLGPFIVFLEWNSSKIGYKDI